VFDKEIIARHSKRKMDRILRAGYDEIGVAACQKKGVRTLLIRSIACNGVHTSSFLKVTHLESKTALYLLLSSVRQYSISERFLRTHFSTVREPCLNESMNSFHRLIIYLEQRCIITSRLHGHVHIVVPSCICHLETANAPCMKKETIFFCNQKSRTCVFYKDRNVIRNTRT
jgi:hypothetical protein